MEKEKNKGDTTKIARWMEFGDVGIYIAVGVSFLGIGVAVFIYSWVVFYGNVQKEFLPAILILVNDLLLVLIILEVLRTILNYLKMRTIILEPFLFVGIIAATRKILLAGARVAILETMADEVFYRYLWEVGVNAFVVIAFALALFLFSRRPTP